MSELRVYEPPGDEFDAKGYPAAWQTVKHLVREQAGHRCVRCLHPYKAGAGRWSRCDERCTHDGPFRVMVGGYIWAEGLERKPPLSDEGVVEAEYRILTVHHLNGVKADLRWWNLASLCQRCHLQIQGKVQMERIWPWEHSDWFKPYAAGWYAFAYLGQDLTRAEVDARLDELLGLERVA